MLKLNTKFAAQTYRAKQEFPALQATNYQPKLNEKVKLCLTQASADFIPEAEQVRLGLTPEMICYGEEEVPMYTLRDDVKWSVLSLPKIMVLDKSTNDIIPLAKGMKLEGGSKGKVTIARVLLSAVVDGSPIVDFDGVPLIWTLKLTSSKTLLIRQPKETDAVSLESLNNKLCRELKVSNVWLLHLLQIGLVAKPKKFTSSVSGESSVGIMFAIDGEPTELSEEAQEVMYNLIESERFKALAEDPFGLNKKQEKMDVSHLPGNSDQSSGYDWSNVTPPELEDLPIIGNDVEWYKSM